MLTEALSLPLRREFADTLPELCVDWRPRTVPVPTLLYFNRALAAELALPCADWDEETLAQVLSGNIVPEGVKPVAQVYAGHQFGGFVPRLGDGRALLLGEARDRSGRLRDLAFKGSGPTPFARNGDGKAAVGPMLREVIIGEALHALGIPTTRALAVVATGEPVFRERALPGAVLTRVAASHLRVGTFEYVAARSDEALLQRLADYAIARHYPPLAGKPDRYLRLLQAVARRQAELIARWMNVGFIHGVMNTDNMSIAGESIDFGPCAFMDAYDPATVFSSIDHYGRYAYGNQPPIALWNLARLAEALLPLLDADREAALAKARAVLNDFAADYETALRAGQRAKLGLATEQPEDARLIDDWLALLAAARADFTASYRALAAAAAGDEAPLRAQIADEAAVSAWLARWRARCAAEDGADAGASARRAAALRLANPRVIPRTHRVEEVLAAATDAGDLGPFERLLAAVRRPFDDDPLLADYATPAPVEFTRSYMTFCGT
ncbi:MAG: YdiU family protein [Burkholderiaceae bacterium]|nr:YdiU family protein [Burkholderiaceae bacterium]